MDSSNLTLSPLLPNLVVQCSQWYTNQKYGCVAYLGRCKCCEDSHKKLRESNWLYREVHDESDEAAKQVIEVPKNTSSTMLEKASDDDIAGFQAFSIRNLDKLSTDSDRAVQSAQCKGRCFRQSTTVS